MSNQLTPHLQDSRVTNGAGVYLHEGVTDAVLSPIDQRKKGSGKRIVIVAKNDASGRAHDVLSWIDSALPAFDLFPAVSLPENLASYRSREQALARRFSELADEWLAATAALSFLQDALQHPAYYRIISLGPDVVPFILKRMRDSGGFWFHALRVLTGTDAVPEDFRGTASQAANLWLEWGRSQGYL